MKTPNLLRYLLLAVAGLFIGQALPSLLPARPPEPILRIGQDLQAAQMSPDRRLLAGIGCSDRSWFVQVWNDRGQEVLSSQPLPAPAGRFHGFAWSPDGKSLAVGAGDEVWVFEPNTGRKRVLAAGPQVRTVEYKGSYLLARTRTATVVWKGDLSKPYWRLDQNYLLLSTLDEKSELLATSCFEDGVRVFDLKKKKQTAHFNPGWISVGLKFSDQGRLLTAGYRNPGNRGQDHLITHDLIHGGPYGPTLTTPGLFGFDVSMDGTRAVTRQYAGGVTWDVKSGKRLSEKSGNSRLLDAINPRGDLVCSDLEDNTAALWSSDDASKEHLLTCPTPLTDMRFVGSDGLLLVGGQACLWRVVAF